MAFSEHIYTDHQQLSIYYYLWKPATPPKELIHISHGMMEHAKRYDYVASKLADNGYLVVAHDHRGHGQTGYQTQLGYLGAFPYTHSRHYWKDICQNLVDIHYKVVKDYDIQTSYLLGHSMGAVVAQSAAGTISNLGGLILCGAPYEPKILMTLSYLIARFSQRVKGLSAASVLHFLTFFPYSLSVKNRRTSLDWLCKNPDFVDAYIEDPLCGQVCSKSFYYDFFFAMKHLQDAMIAIPSNCPLFLFCGDEDPVTHYGKSLIKQTDFYIQTGHTDVTRRLYEGGRHELLNEPERDSVIQDILNWLSDAL